MHHRKEYLSFAFLAFFSEAGQLAFFISKIAFLAKLKSFLLFPFSVVCAHTYFSLIFRSEEVDREKNRKKTQAAKAKEEDANKEEE